MIRIIRKDFMLIGITNLLFTFLSPFIFLVFVFLVQKNSLGLISFILTALISILMVNQSIDLQEEKSPNAIALLCSTPIPRNKFVFARYLLNYIVFLYCYLIYHIMTAFVFKTGSIDLLSVTITFAIISLVVSIYLPFKYFLGLKGTKYVMVVAAIIIGFGLRLFSLLYDAINNIALPTIYFAFLVEIITCNGISIMLSIKTMNKKEL